KSPSEDPIVKGLSPDGKSSTVQFVVEIRNYEAQRKPGDKVSVKSQYVSGAEQIPNPEYTRLKDELDQSRRNLDDPKQKNQKLANERIFQQKQAELNQVPHTLNREKYTDYNYEQMTYTQHVAIELRLVLRDNLSKE